MIIKIFLQNQLIWVFVLIFSSSLFAQSENEWIQKNIYSGQKPECIYCSPKYDILNENFLRVSISNNSDVIIKLHNYNTGECIRCVFVSAGDTYEIKNIPEGIYTVKIAYGNNWAVNKSDYGFSCKGKFLDDAFYQEGENLLDFNLVYYNEGYEVPSYEIRLEVKTHNKSNEFDTHKISEEEFYN